MENSNKGIFLIENLLSSKECENYILFSETRGYEEAKVSLTSGAKMMKGIRNNERLEYIDESLAEMLWERVKGEIPIEIDKKKAIQLSTKFKFYRYEGKQRFNKHRDGRIQVGDFESRLTFLIYLNDDFEGGETEFESTSIKPKEGMGMCFIHELKHKGCAVTDDGVKYVLRTDVLYEK